MWSKCSFWWRKIFPLLARWSVGTKNASCSSFDFARWWNFRWSFSWRWFFTIPKIDLIRTFSGTKLFLGMTVSIALFACLPLISFLIRRDSVLIAWSRALISSCSVTFLFRAIGVRGERIGRSFSSISIFSISGRLSSFLP